MRAHKKLVKAALALGYTVSVFDGEEWQVKRSRSSKDIEAAIQSTDEVQLRFRDADNNLVGWALVSDDISFEDDETVIDYSCTEWIENALK